MNLIVLVALGMLALAVALAAPVAESELRQGRNSFRAVRVEAVARGTLSELEQGTWIAGATAVSIGDSLTFPSLSASGGIVVERSLLHVGPDLWLGAARVVQLDQGGSVLASSRQGLLLRVGTIPPDTLPRAIATSRPWVTGFQ